MDHKLFLHAEPSGSVAWKAAQPSGRYGLPDPLTDRSSRHADDVKTSSHPLEFSERNYFKNQEANDFAMLQQTQGIHAPFRLMAERKIASKIQRMPGLQSSHLMSDILTGRLDDINFEDILGDPMDADIVGQPHILMERQLRM